MSGITPDFDQYILKRAEKIMKNVHGRIVVAVSGGKDSLACSHILNRLNIKHELMHINLGISEFSEQSRQVVTKFAKINNTKLSIVPVEKYTHKTIPEYAPILQKKYHKHKPCALCGLFKRYIMNRWAWDNGFDFIVTGHNLDDTVATLVINIMSQDVNQLFRIAPVTQKIENIKMLSRCKPLYWVKESLIAKYIRKHNIEVVTAECPYNRGSHQNNVKKAILQFEKTNKNFMISLLKTIKKIKKNYNFNTADIVVEPCQKCGFATTTKVCKFCRIVNQPI